MWRNLLGFVVLFLVVSHDPAASAPDQFGNCSEPPGYYRVASTARDSSLHIRATPDLESRRTGQLQRSDVVFSSGIRVIRDGVAWQSIKVLQNEGWVPMNSLWRTLPLTIDSTPMPIAGYCGDFQPLWSMLWSGHEFRLSVYPGRYIVKQASVRDGNSPGTALARGSTEGGDVTIIYSDSLCTDPIGKPLGWGHADVLIGDKNGQRLYSGCCEPSHDAFVPR